MLSLVRTALLPTRRHLLPAGRAHVRSSAHGLSGSGLLPDPADLSGALSCSRRLSAQLLPMATPRRRQRLLRITMKCITMNDERGQKTTAFLILFFSRQLHFPIDVSHS